MTLNIIHLSPNNPLFDERQKNNLICRELLLKKELEEQDCEDYKIWDGIYNEKYPFIGVCQSHKQIVRDAKEKGLKQVVICEDDIKFTDKGALKYFLDNIPESFDLYFGMSYSHHDYAGNKMNSFFDGMTLYMVHERFYDTFLSLNEFNHIDRELSNLVLKYEFFVCKPYVCEQYDGYSFTAKKERNYGYRLQGKSLFKTKISS